MDYTGITDFIFEISCIKIFSTPAIKVCSQNGQWPKVPINLTFLQINSKLIQ
jgi:hypothetical protein